MTGFTGRAATAALVRERVATVELGSPAGDVRERVATYRRSWPVAYVRETAATYGATMPSAGLASAEGEARGSDAGAADTTAVPLDLDALETLGDEIATLAAHIHAATHQLLVLLARFDHLGGWEVEGYASCAHWLAFRTGIDLGAAREKVRAARALVDLPETSAAMARGELSFSKVVGPYCASLR